MSPRKTLLLAFALACFSNLTASIWAADGVAVNVQPPAVETRTFDPDNPPDDMPPLSPEEAAIARSTFGVQSSIEAAVVSEQTQAQRTTSRVRVEAVHMDLSLAITIWLPENAPNELIAHEQGHQYISELSYQDAERIGQSLAQKYIGQTFSAQGSTPEAARQAALNRVINELNGAYMAATQIPSSRVNDIFDAITEHGRKRDITVEQAIRQSMRQYEEEQRKSRPQQHRAPTPQPPRQPAR